METFPSYKVGKNLTLWSEKVRAPDLKKDILNQKKSLDKVITSIIIDNLFFKEHAKHAKGKEEKLGVHSHIIQDQCHRPGLHVGVIKYIIHIICTRDRPNRGVQHCKKICKFYDLLPTHIKANRSVICKTIF